MSVKVLDTPKSLLYRGLINHFLTSNLFYKVVWNLLTRLAGLALSHFRLNVLKMCCFIQLQSHLNTGNTVTVQQSVNGIIVQSRLIQIRRKKGSNQKFLVVCRSIWLVLFWSFYLSLKSTPKVLVCYWPKEWPSRSHWKPSRKA